MIIVEVMVPLSSSMSVSYTHLLILAVGAVEKNALKSLKKLNAEREFKNGQSGWSSVRMAVIDLSAHKVHTNRMGDPLKNILNPFL